MVEAGRVVEAESLGAAPTEAAANCKAPSGSRSHSAWRQRCRRRSSSAVVAVVQAAVARGEAAGVATVAMGGALAGAVGRSAPGCCHKGLPRMCRCSAHRSSDISAMGVRYHSLTAPRYW